MKKIITEPFDRKRIPPKQNLFFMPFLWLLSRIYLGRNRLRIESSKIKGLKPPFLVLGTHNSFTDFPVTQLALFPHRINYISELEGFENYGEWLYRQLGCLGTRKFINDISLIKNMKKVIDRKGVLVLYPEARYANVGTSTPVPDSVAKLTKYLKVPVVALNMKGNYLHSPIWNLELRREANLSAEAFVLLTAGEVEEQSVEEITAAINNALSYDEYEWQYNSRNSITYNKRAEGLELALYQCAACESEFNLHTSNAEIFCTSCGARWRMTEYGKLEPLTDNESKFTHIPCWYEWQRKNVIRLIDNNKYSLKMRVRIESLPNAVNFIDLGEGFLLHNMDGFELSFFDYGEASKKTLRFSSASLFSIHTEFDYRGKGQCITLSTLDNTYFIYPLEDGFNATKIQFATEAFYNIAHNNRLTVLLSRFS